MSRSRTPPSTGGISLGSAAGRWIVAASVLGSGAVFLEGTVVNVALPAIGRDLGLSLAGLEWVVNGYLLTLSALMLLGGALGDRYDRGRVFALGAIAFALGCVCAALAPTPAILFACRLAQGAAGALLVPNSLALLEASFRGTERGAAIGQWAAWSAVSTAVGPFAGGALVRAGSWRWVFACVVPFALAAGAIALVHARPAARPAARRDTSVARAHVDYVGALLVTVGLAGVTWALVEGQARGFGARPILGAGSLGIAALVAFLVVEHRSPNPLMPLAMFRSAQFTGANATTLLVYAALGGLFFLLMLRLQDGLGYDALQAGSALLPLNAVMLALSPTMGRLATRFGPRVPMTAGALGAALGMLLFARLHAGASYVSSVLPALLVFGLGLATLVAPLTTAVLGAVGSELAGVASAVNNAVARVAGLLAVAILPVASGLGGLHDAASPRFAAGFTRAMVISAVLCALGAVVAWLTVRRVPDVSR